MSIEASEEGVQFLRNAPEQYNFESELRPEADHDPLGAPVAQVISDATLEGSAQSDFPVPVSGALNDDRAEVLGEPERLEIDFTSDAIAGASLFDHPAPSRAPGAEGDAEAEELEAEDDPSITYADPLRTPEVVSDDPSDADADRLDQIQQQLDERVKRRLHTDTLPHTREEKVERRVEERTRDSAASAPRANPRSNPR